MQVFRSSNFRKSSYLPITRPSGLCISPVDTSHALLRCTILNLPWRGPPSPAMMSSQSSLPFTNITRNGFLWYRTCWLWGEDDTILSLAQAVLATVADVGVGTRDVDFASLVSLFGEDVDVVALVLAYGDHTLCALFPNELLCVWQDILEMVCFSCLIFLV